MRTFEGKFDGRNVKIAIVAGRFNEFITSKLIGGALDVLKRNDVSEENIDIAWVPGAFEIPLITKKLANTQKYDAIIATYYLHHLTDMQKVTFLKSLLMHLETAYCFGREGWYRNGD